MKVAFIGWRGMVGSVLMNRILEKEDHLKHSYELFSTSQKGQDGPIIQGHKFSQLQDAFDTETLKNFDVILTCQGSDYTNKIYPILKKEQWNGYWVDAASTLRLQEDSLICLDPVNNDKLLVGLENGIKTFVGGNCTVSLMLMGLQGLFDQNAVEWVTSMTYQAASGAGAKNMIELIDQMHFLGEVGKSATQDGVNILDLDHKITSAFSHPHFPKTNFGHPLAGNLLPWIDVMAEYGQSKEEWKGMTETNKILGKSNNQQIPIDGTCVRIGAMRSHSQALTIKLKKDLPMDEITQMIDEANEWAHVIDNDKEKTLQELTPARVSGTLNIPVGRLRKMRLGNDYLNAFTVGDQLLWGAAEPIRRMVNIIGEFKK